MTPSQIATIRASRYRIKLGLREVYKVTEWRKGCVYRTKSLGYIVCGPDYQLLNGGMLTSVNTKWTRLIGG